MGSKRKEVGVASSLESMNVGNPVMDRHMQRWCLQRELSVCLWPLVGACLILCYLTCASEPDGADRLRGISIGGCLVSLSLSGSSVSAVLVRSVHYTSDNRITITRTIPITQLSTSSSHPLSLSPLAGTHSSVVCQLSLVLPQSLHNTTSASSSGASRCLHPQLSSSYHMTRLDLSTILPVD